MLLLDRTQVFDNRFQTSDLFRENGHVMVEPPPDAQVCLVVLGDIDLGGLDGVQQLLLLGHVALKEELGEHRLGGLVQLDNLEIMLVKCW